jgi:hypothetical protein
LKNELCVKNRKDERIVIKQLINKSFDQKGFRCISVISSDQPLKKITICRTSICQTYSLLFIKLAKITEGIAVLALRWPRNY